MNMSGDFLRLVITFQFSPRRQRGAAAECVAAAGAVAAHSKVREQPGDDGARVRVRVDGAVVARGVHGDGRRAGRRADVVMK